MIMPFGKHKGKDIRTIPPRYLEWVWNNCKLHGSLKKAIDAVLSGEEIPEDIEETDEDKMDRIVKPYVPSEGESAPW
jgi:hypothetical protein